MKGRTDGYFATEKGLQATGERTYPCYYRQDAPILKTISDY